MSKLIIINTTLVFWGWMLQSCTNEPAEFSQVQGETKTISIKVLPASFGDDVYFDSETTNPAIAAGETRLDALIEGFDSAGSEGFNTDVYFNDDFDTGVNGEKSIDSSNTDTDSSGTDKIATAGSTDSTGTGTTGSTDSTSTTGSTDSTSTTGSTDSTSTTGSTDSTSTAGSTDSTSTAGSTDSTSTAGSTDSTSTAGSTDSTPSPTTGSTELPPPGSTTTKPSEQNPSETVNRSEIALCAKLAGVKQDKVIFENTSSIKSGSVIALKIAGNKKQETILDLVGDANSSLRGICIFAAGNQVKFSSKIGLKVDNFIYVGRGNEGRGDLVVEGNGAMTAVVVSLKGNANTFHFKSNGKPSCNDIFNLSKDGGFTCE